MMQYYFVADGNGRITRSFNALDDTEAQHIAGMNNISWPMLSLSHPIDLLREWWTGEVVALRPVPPAPPALVAGVAATWAGLPVGAVVTVTDPATGVVAGTGEADEAGELSLTLPAGPWRLAINEVFPAVAGEWLIEVPPA